MARLRTHPGEVLREEFLAVVGMGADHLAAAIDAPVTYIEEIMREKRSVTADTALRLAKEFDTSPEYWLNLQMAYDFSRAKKRRGVGG